MNIELKHLLNDVNTNQWLTKIVDQLNKDLQLSGINEIFNDVNSPINLVDQLHQLSIRLLENRNLFNKLLYVIDISEENYHKLFSKSEINAEYLSLIILKRIYLKIYYREMYNKK